MARYDKAILCLTLAMVISACSQTQSASPQAATSDKQEAAQVQSTQETSAGHPKKAESGPMQPVTEPKDGKDLIFEIVGTIQFKNLEGGFYALIGDNGKNYLPLNLTEEHRRGGLRVKVQARVKQVYTIANFGTPVELVSVEVIGQTDGNLM